MVCKSTPNLAFWTVAQTGKVTPLATGPPGCGKSRGVEAFARAAGRQCYILIGSLREPADIGGYPYPVHGDQPYMARHAPKVGAGLPAAASGFCSSTSLRPFRRPVQTPMLGVIAEKRVGDSTLPADVWMLAACNPTDCAANGY